MRKVVFGRLRVERWVESHAPGLKPLPLLRARDKPFITLLLELKQFISFYIIISHLSSKITCLHVSTLYALMSFVRMIATLFHWSPLPVVWTNRWLPHHIMRWHHQEPVTLSRVATCPADIGIEFWPESLASSNFLIQTHTCMWFSPLASF